MTRDPKALMLSLNLSLNNKSADSIKATCACYLVDLVLFLNGGISPVPPPPEADSTKLINPHYLAQRLLLKRSKHISA